MFMLPRFLTFVWIAFSAILPSLTLAQFTLQGTVIDSEGASLVGAHVAIQNNQAIVTTDRTGAFYFSNLAAGEVTLEVTYVGFESFSTTLRLTADTSLEITLAYTTVFCQRICGFCLTSRSEFAHCLFIG
jgi:iron complex outermembrane receptor protein